MKIRMICMNALKNIYAEFHVDWQRNDRAMTFFKMFVSIDKVLMSSIKHHIMHSIDLKLVVFICFLYLFRYGKNC